jgi:hypothetical protein
MSAARCLAKRLRRFDMRVCDAFDLWARLGFTWREAWKIAGRWQS